MVISVLFFKIKLHDPCMHAFSISLAKFNLILNQITWLVSFNSTITFNHSLGTFLQQIHWLYVGVRNVVPPRFKHGHPSHLKQAVWEAQWAWPGTAALPKGLAGRRLIVSEHVIPANPWTRSLTTRANQCHTTRNSMAKGRVSCQKRALVDAPARGHHDQ